MRSCLGIGIVALALSGCSPAAHIVTTVRSASDVSFKVSTEKEDPGCIDHLIVRDSGGAARWEITRKAGDTGCFQEVAFPKVPPGYTAQQSATVLARGDYWVEARSGIYRGVDKFTIG